MMLSNPYSENQPSADSVTLLYQNATKRIVTLQDVISTLSPGVQQTRYASIGDLPVKSLIKYVFMTWDAEQLGTEQPVSVYQVRLIHLGRTLEDKMNFEDFEQKLRLGYERKSAGETQSGGTVDEAYDYLSGDNAGPLLKDLKLDVSDIIHVSLRPVEVLKKIKRKTNTQNILNMASSSNLSTNRRNSKAGSTAGEEDENVNANGGSGGCCVIV